MSKRMPRRVQRKRTKGWRMPRGAVYVGRGTPYGNPYRVARTRRDLESGDPMVVATPAEAAARYRDWLDNTRRGQCVRDLLVNHLWGRDLACWCPPGQPCHADVLLELANPRGLAELENPYYRMWDKGDDE